MPDYWSSSPLSSLFSISFNHALQWTKISTSSSQKKMVPPYELDSLYCSEDHWEDDDDQEERGFHEQPYSNLTTESSSPILAVAEQDLFWENDELSSLFSREKPNELFKTIQIDPSLAVARRSAVEWMLKVNAHYSFSALTAVLAVDYLDRFLSCFHFQRDKPWMSQLAAVACISLAAKVEETQVPLLLDLQVCFSRNLNNKPTEKWSDWDTVIINLCWGFDLCRWKTVDICLKLRPLRKWSFLCSLRFNGGWILLPHFLLWIISQGGLDSRTISAGKFFGSVSELFSLLF